MRHVFVRFLEEIEDTKKTFRNYRGFLPYATFGTWKKTTLAKNRISKIFMYFV